jgi:hypothetical protein
MKHIKDLPECRILNPDETLQEGDLFVNDTVFAPSDPHYYGCPVIFDHTKSKYHYYVRPINKTISIKDKLTKAVDNLKNLCEHKTSCKIWYYSEEPCDCGLLDNYNNILDIIKEI